MVTDKELNAIAAAAIMGLNMIPKKGYNRPAAMGMHSEEYSIDEEKVKDKERMYRTLMKEKP